MQKGRFKLANLVTYVGVICAVSAMLCAGNGYIHTALICLILSGLCDLFDGRFARGFKRTEEQKLVGIELDSLSDVLNFLICPVMICFGMGMQAWYHYVIFIWYVIAGITRLACYNVDAAINHKDVPVTYYNGIPVTYAAVVFPIVGLLSLVLDESVFHVIYIIVMLMLGLLFVADVKIPKPKKAASVVFSVAAIGAVIAFLVF